MDREGEQLTSESQIRVVRWSRGAVLSGLLTVMILLAGCQTTAPMKASPKASGGTYTVAVADYDISLVSVERPAESVRRYGRQRIEAVSGEGGRGFFSFEDGMVRIKWHPTSDDIAFLIGNKTRGPMRILWDEATFIDEQGNSHRLIHAGTGYEDRNAVHPPTVIAAGGALNDFIHPADYFRPEEGSGKGGLQTNRRLGEGAVPADPDQGHRRGNEAAGRSCRRQDLPGDPCG